MTDEQKARAFDALFRTVQLMESAYHYHKVDGHIEMITHLLSAFSAYTHMPHEDRRVVERYLHDEACERSDAERMKEYGHL